MPDLRDEPRHPLDWDPKEHEKRYYRHRSTGDRGYLVGRGGKDVIRMDREHEMIRKLNDDWMPDEETRPITHAALGRVAFESDKALCFALGLHEQSRKEWASLTDQARIAWMNEGPKREPRRGLWRAIMGALKELAG